MRRAVVTAWLMAVACSAQPLRPSAFDPSKGTALVALGPGADADRLDTSKRLRLIGVRDAAGHTVLGPSGEDQCTQAPIHLNPGRYTLEVERCTSTCTSGCSLANQLTNASVCAAEASAPVRIVTISRSPSRRWVRRPRAAPA